MSSNLRLMGLGRPGEDDSGSNAGSNEGRREAALLSFGGDMRVLGRSTWSAMMETRGADVPRCWISTGKVCKKVQNARCRLDVRPSGQPSLKQAGSGTANEKAGNGLR